MKARQTQRPSVEAPNLAVIRWLPNETLFSLCAREHICSGDFRSETTTARLFGRFRQGVRHDIPALLDTYLGIAERLDTPFPDLIKNHTILPFYLPWRSLKCEERVIAEIRSGRSGNVKSLLGLMSSRFGADHPLKYCPMCCSADTARFSTTYWHLDHQYPGVWSCPAHFCKLVAATVKTNGIGPYLWLLPHQSPGFKGTLPPEHAPADWLAFTSLVHEAVQGLAGHRIDYARLRMAYATMLVGSGYGRGRTQLNLPRMTSDFLEALRALSDFRDLRTVQATTGSSARYLQSILRRCGHSTNALRHLVFVHWLFGTWSRFWYVYQSSTSEALVGRVQPPSPDRRPSDQARCRALTLITEHGYSARKAALEIEVQTETVIRWAVKAGVELGHRSSPMHQKIIDCLMTGRRATEVATQLGIPIGVVTRLVHAQIGLQRTWSEACARRRWIEAHQTWEHLLMQWPHSGMKALRSRAPGTYAWLYRNDRAWLRAVAPTHVKISQATAPRADWASRDALLASQVRNYIAEKPTCKLGTRKQTLFALVPAIRRWESKAHLLPLTFELVRAYLATPRSRPRSKRTCTED